MLEQIAVTNVVLALTLDPQTREVGVVGPMLQAGKKMAVMGLLECAKDAVRTLYAEADTDRRVVSVEGSIPGLHV